jgi:hypothetical protein
MALLFDDDYRVLDETGLSYEEDQNSRFLILRAFPLAAGLYKSSADSISAVDVLNVIPTNYNTAGCDMFWVHPQLARIDGKVIPNINGAGQDSRTHKGVEYYRWSRHWNKHPWKPKVDNIRTILSRIEWALKNPDADKK